MTQISLVQVLLAQAHLVQTLLASTPLRANKLSGKQHKKYLEQVYITSLLDIYFLINKFINNNADAQLQYTIFRQNKISGLFEKNCLVKQANNKKNKKPMLTQLLTMQRWAYIQ